MAEAPSTFAADHADQNAPSVALNKPDPSYAPPAPPEPLVGEVKAGAAHPDSGDAPSVAQNAPEDPPAESDDVPSAPYVGDEVAVGASTPGEAVPSIAGTSYDPHRGEEPPAEPPPPTPEIPKRKRGIFSGPEG